MKKLVPLRNFATLLHISSKRNKRS